jgi:hypothetical protein
MNDIEKAKFILYLLSKQELKLNGSKEAFSFVESYKWLLELAKLMDQKAKNGNK